MIKREVEEKEKVVLVASNCKVVEYLEPIMSKELLFKFPDNSAFDFDYSQSSIWSPLVPRTYYSPMDFDWEAVTPRKLVYGFELGSDKKGKRSCFKTVNSSIKKKKKKNKAKGSCELSPAPFKGANCAPFASKGWSKVLKAASKHFKKNKKAASHVKLSTYLTHTGS